MSHTTPTVVVDSGASVIEGAEMNANELADKLEQGHWEGGTREQAATMLRQQQAEIEALKSDGKVCARCGAIAYDPVITQTAKTLTDEVYFCSRCGKRLGDGIHTCTPPADILRKAQEK